MSVRTDALPHPYRPGTARAAFSYRDFRWIWIGLFASNVGTWMQNFTLAAYGWDLTHSAAYVGLLGFAQLGPILLLSTVGGVLADAIDRRRLIVAMQFGQLVGSLVLALLAAAGHPSTVAIFLCVLAIGVFKALNAPAMIAVNMINITSVPMFAGRMPLSATEAA